MMNHIYKTVWNKSKQMFVVVSEIAGSNGKAASEKSTGSPSTITQTFTATLTALASLLFVQNIQANPTQALGSTLVHNANNGVQVIDIAAANQAGISHNRYINYNVNQTGQVLNNAPMSAQNLSVMTNLAGKIHTNANLKDSARLILNEVTGTQRSALNGYIEVAGQKADVVIANPYGITCTGCGFINTDYSVLTTGKPNIGLDGRLTSFDITSGDITIDGLGLNAADQPILKLIARNLYLNGQVNAQDLTVVTGANQYNFETGQVNQIATDVNQPSYAIDSTQFGGIYANKINLLATEQGVGVRMAGNVAANSGEFVLTSAGQIQLKNTISAQTTLNVQNYDDSIDKLNIQANLTAKNINLGNFDVTLQDSNLLAEEKLAIDAQAIQANQSKIEANSHVNLTAKDLIDLKQTQIQSNAAIGLAANQVSAQQTSLEAQDTLRVNAIENIDLDKQTTLSAQDELNLVSESGRIILTDAVDLKSKQNINLQANKGEISVIDSNITTEQELGLQAHDIRLDANTNSNYTSLNASNDVSLNNTAVIVAQKDLSINAKNVNISGQVLADTINSHAQVNYTSGEHGKVLAQQTLNLNAKNINLNGVTGAKDLNLVAENLLQKGHSFAENNYLINVKDAQLLGKNEADQMTMNVTNSLTQHKDSSISVSDDLTINAQKLHHLGHLIANNLTVDADELIQDGYFSAVDQINLNSSSATLSGMTVGNDVSILTQQFTNKGTLLADNLLNITAKDIVLDGNPQTVVAANNVNMSADTLQQNSGAVVQATTHLDYDATETLNVFGDIKANTAILNSLNQLNLGASSKVHVNGHLESFAKNMDLNGDILATRLNLDALEQLNSNANIEVLENLNLNASSAVLDGQIITNNLTVLVDESIDQEGEVYVNQDMEVSAKHINQNGIVFADNIQLQANQRLTQGQSAQLVTDHSVILNAQEIDMNGISVAKELDANAQKKLVLGGKVQIENNSQLNADHVQLNGLLLSKNATIHAASKLEQSQDNVLTVSNDLEIVAKNLQLAGQTLATDIDLKAQENLTQNGNLQAYRDISLIAAKDIIFTPLSQTVALGDIYIDAKNHLNTQQTAQSGAVISSNQDITVKAGNTATLQGQFIAKNIDVTAKNNLSTAQGAMLVAQDQIDLTSTDQSVTLAGQSSAAQQNISAASSINVLKDANVQALQQLKFTADSLSNEGTVRNSGTTGFALKNFLNKGYVLSNSYYDLSASTPEITFNQFTNNGLVLSNESLNLKTQAFNNTGDVISNHDLSLNTNVFNNAETAKISALKDISLEIQQDQANNNGLVSAAKNLVIDAKNLTNNHTLQANVVDLKVNNLLNQKDILAANRVNLNAQTDISNTGEIYANNLVDIVAGNAVTNKNKIYTARDGNSKVSIKSAALINDLPKTGLITSDQLIIKANDIKNSAKILAGQANISAQNGKDKTKLANIGSSSFALQNNVTQNASNLNADIINNKSANFYLDDAGIVTVSGELNNKGLIYAENHSDLSVKSLLTSNEAKVVLDQSNLKVSENFVNKGNISATDGSNLNFSALTNQANLILEDSALNVTGHLTNQASSTSQEAIINAAGNSSITAKTLDNANLIFGSDKQGHLLIDADQVNLKENSGLISQGQLSINTKKTTKNTITNLGQIFSQGDLTIGKKGAAVTDFSNLMSKYKGTGTSANSTSGGVVSSDANIDFNVNNFTNNYHINNSNGNIEINVGGKFTNETVYYGDKLVLGYAWTSPDYNENAPNRDERDKRYRASNVLYEQVANAGANDGVDAVLVTENWKLSTLYNGTLDYAILSPYMGDSNNLAQIRANSGSITLNLNNKNTTAQNHGAKIVAKTNIDINAEGVNFENKTFELFEDRDYTLQYLLMSDKDNRHSIAYRLNMEKNDDLVNDKIDDDDDYERTNNYRDAFKGHSNIKFRDYHRESNVQTQFRNFLKSNSSDLKPFSRKGQGGETQDVQAVISAGEILKVTAANLKNDSNGKAFVGDTPKTEAVFNGDSKPAEEKTCTAAGCTLAPDVKPELSLGITDKAVDIDAQKNEVGSVNHDVQLNEVTTTPVDEIVTADPVSDTTQSIDPVVPQVSVPRVVNNDYPIDKIPTINLALPNAQNKYGQYIVSKKPNSEFLVESNPLYGQSADVIGSDYLRDTLNIVPDATLKRLGDGRYEQELVRQQVEQITNKATISDTQMQQYFDNAIEAAKDLGFTYGKPLSTAQIKQLDKDIVWMVEKVVEGQRVLVPQVYLSYETLQNIDDSGSVLEGKEGVNLEVDSLQNNESTIKGGTVIIDAKKDIDNIGATIKGRDVQLTSKEGSINNITEAHHYGDSHTASTYIGPTAGIISENNLVLDAAQDINIVGAKLKAGGSAVLEAGNDINIETIQDKRATTSTSRDGKTTTNVQSTTHIGSQIDIGGDAYLKSGNDVVISGSEVNVGGSFVADTGGDFKLVSVQDTVQTNTESSKSGFGVGGGLWGSQTTQTNEFIGTNKASTLNVGGVVDIASENKVVIEGSDINVSSSGMSRIHGAKGVDILDGKDEYSKETTVTTTTFLKLENDSSAQAGASATAIGESGEAKAEAGASAEASSQTNLKLMESKVENTTEKEKKSVSSNITSNGGLSITSDEGTVHVRGSNVDVKGALVVDAKNILVEAGKNEKTTTSNTQSTSVGIYREDSASASASAGAGVDASNGVASAGANVGVEANLESTTTFGAMSESSSSQTKAVTNNLASLKGGTVSLTAQETARFEGADVRSEGAMRIKATDIENIAVQDTYESSSSSKSDLAGVYVGASANASAGASAGTYADGLVPMVAGSASAEASVSAEVSAGLRTNSKSEDQTYAKTTNLGNTFSAGGDFERIAENSITDEATMVTSGGTIRQAAKTVTENAVHDTETFTYSSSEKDARLGVYAGVGAGVEAEAHASTGQLGSYAGKGTEVNKPEASAGLQGSYNQSDSNGRLTVSKAVVSNFKAQNIESDVSGQMELNGANFEASDKLSLNAGSLILNEAVSSVTSTTSNQSVDVSAKVGLVGTPSAEFGFGVGDEKQSHNLTIGQGSNLSGKNVSINVAGTLESEGLVIQSEQKTVKADKTIRRDSTRTFESESDSNSTGFSFGASDEGLKIGVNDSQFEMSDDKVTLER